VSRIRRTCIAIVSPDLLTREGLGAVLKRARVFHPVVKAASTTSSTFALPNEASAIILLEVSPAIREDVASVLSALPRCKIVAFARDDNERSLRESLQAGVHGYAACISEKSSSLLSVLDRVSRGERTICSHSLGQLVRVFCDQRSVPGVPVLTPRETDVLQLLTAGSSNRQIAETLHLSVGTVKNVITQILRKLGVQNRAAASARTQILVPQQPRAS
jgi:DNA-binding NarL/FixJ family response regulator